MASSCEFDRLFVKNVVHIHEKIFLSLDCMSFMNCLDVSRSLNDLLTSQSFIKRGKSISPEDISMDLRFAVRSGLTDTVRRIFSSGAITIT